MMTMTYNRRQGLSILLVLSMIFSMWLTVSPMNHADAGILSAVGGIASQCRRCGAICRRATA